MPTLKKRFQALTKIAGWLVLLVKIIQAIQSVIDGEAPLDTE